VYLLLLLLLQELEHENASLSAQLSEQLAVKNSEIETLTYKLGAAEYELENAVKNCAETTEELNATITTLRNEVQAIVYIIVTIIVILRMSVTGNSDHEITV